MDHDNDTKSACCGANTVISSASGRILSYWVDSGTHKQVRQDQGGFASHRFEVVSYLIRRSKPTVPISSIDLIDTNVVLILLDGAPRAGS